MKYLPYFAIIWFLAISLVSIVITCYDKWAAKSRPRHRTPEKTLLLLSALGGSIAMYCTMHTIRHKTKHMKFMIGIPVILVLQLAAAVGILYIL